MTFAGISYIAVVIAAVVAFLFGWVWYGTLGKHWMAACGKSEADRPKSMPIGPMITTFIGLLVMAWVLAGLLGHLGHVSLWNGVVSGAFCWLGFVVTTLAASYAFQGRSRVLTVIDGGHWLGVLVLEGAVIGAIGV
jgi:hypothetical protein